MRQPQSILPICFTIFLNSKTDPMELIELESEFQIKNPQKGTEFLLK